MSVDINSVNLTGRLVADPKTPTETITTFSLAVNGRGKSSNGQWVDIAHFVEIVTHGHTAEACAKNLTKGRQVAIDGSLRQEHWQTKDGQKRSALKVVAHQVKFLDRKREQQAAGDEPDFGPADEDFGGGGDFSDDEPF